MTFAAVFLFLLLQNPGGSLYSDSAPNAFLFRDFKARGLNDILTIQIDESASASNSAKTDTKKESEIALKASAIAGLQKTSLANLLATTSALNFAGQGSTSRTGQLQAFVTGRVSQVFPNGDLGIEGVKEVTINRERQTLRIRGIVRAKDIGPNNVILSTSIANMEVVFDGKGIVSDANKPGFLFRLVQWMTPF